MFRPSHEHGRPSWLQTKASSWFWSLTPTCKEVARLTSEGHDHPLPPGMRLRLRGHRAFCQGCARYAKQLDLAHEASHHFPEHLAQMDGPCLNGDACARIKRALREVMEKQVVAIGGLILGLSARALIYAF